ncbi:putative LysR-family transcriptional regulator [Xenorhabdus bovienii str. Jollieti]|uniref:Putative LysR-family transcriptional regulator n=1 Tax=Xenorhabdus bovienii (strain SS-2004) TaxID=406818 RepID=D3UYD0_XENBS|nr:LysR family transcriptional regulator [Xenorhabdus bovienii]CBJ79308.1 putative LysR-family transcriptional regulator [Xenorhabdus bovienii SS-2004]CDH30153.1 putative LysR-family transcriptional regulator [Xenorhabdus bovienii str. Jollieti]
MSYLIQLRSFLDVYRSGSISKAATRLGVSQPAVSAHVHSLESFMGSVLFTRRSHGVIPTAEADDLVLQIGTHLDAIETKLSLIRGKSKKIEGVVKIIAPADFLWAKSANILSSIINKQLRFKLLIGDRKKIYSSLNDGDSDLAFTTSCPDENKFGFEIIGKEKLIIVTSASIAAELKNKSISPEILEKYPLISYDNQLPLIRDYYKLVFGVEADILPSITISDLRVIGRIISDNNGWTVMPEYLCEDGFKSRKVFKINHNTNIPENNFYLVWNKSALRHPRVLYVKNHIINLAQQGYFG